MMENFQENSGEMMPSKQTVDKVGYSWGYLLPDLEVLGAG